ncbi:MAG: DEAD/DEAH box helicase family protein [Deltaproteobacteria bacterium]|nr:DEAD/DEAH box helicase family protein [Deltaproteobacteria bacterium]
MTGFEVPEPILNSPYGEPQAHWRIVEGEPAEVVPERRPPLYYYRPPGQSAVEAGVGTAIELKLVARIRERVKAWQDQGYPGVTRTTLELIRHWRKDGRGFRLFFAQIEAAETIIFLAEARRDFRQGIEIPPDEPTPQQKAEGASAFNRFASKMATGTGKTTVMAMLAAWSILNKVNNRSDGRFSDAVLVVCPNITIKTRLRELDPSEGEASIYRTRDLVPSLLMPSLAQGKVLVTNWHIFERQTIQVGGVPAKVSKIGVPLRTTETITIGPRTTTARGVRYLTESDFRRQRDLGLLRVIEEERDKKGNLKRIRVESHRYVESDTKWTERVLDREMGNKQNILVMNDEAHHAYRIRAEGEEGSYEDPEEAELEADFIREATVWVEGLDRIHRLRGINLCVDFSATPFFLAKAGKDANRPFPWVVSDFGLTEAIESGLTKIPELAVRDTTGAEIPGYFNVWEWIMPKLSASERGGSKGSPKPEAILKYAHHPVAMLGGLWEETLKQREKNPEDPRPPVFIIVCKNTRIAKVVYDWLALDERPAGIPPANIPGFLNAGETINTIRVDTRVVQETDTEGAKADEMRWMRLTLDTIGKTQWPVDRQGRPLYPEGFEELAKKLERPFHPPGRDVRCIVSVGMLTEGWDCNTVTHIIGLRPFMSQLLCEQVVGRGLRRTDYEPDPETGKLSEEVAKVFGVPFEVIPFKASSNGAERTRTRRHHIRAIPAKERYRITFPRVEGYTQAIRNRVWVDWDHEPPVSLDPLNIPPEVQMKAALPANGGRPSITGPGRLKKVSLNPFRSHHRRQELVFELAANLSREYTAQPQCELSSHVLFPQLVGIVGQYLKEKVLVNPPADLMDVFLSPYYGWVIERLVHAIRPDTSQGEAPEVPKYERHRGPGSTDEVDFWTGKDVREVERCHLNYAVAETKKWEQSAAYYIDTHPGTEAFVKNTGLGFAVPYFHNGQSHDYIPDFIVRLTLSKKEAHYLIIETKGFDPLEGVKTAAAERWVKAVNADGQFGIWQYAIARKPHEVSEILNHALENAS